jgi:uncharacterized protein YrrD
MLRSLHALRGNHVRATDGDVGKVTDFYFDDLSWTVRYLVVDTSGFWDTRHEVLVSPNAFRHADWVDDRIELNLTQEKVRNSPPVDLAKPISRQYEEQYHRYYNWPFYWLYTDVGSMMAASEAMATVPRQPAEQSHVDPHLHSTEEVTSYRLQASDGDLGHVEDFIVNDESWQIRYMAVNTSNWWFGRSVLVAPAWIEQTDWVHKSVHVRLPRAVIQKSPEWRPEQAVNREYEVRLYDYYGRPAYWREDERNEQTHR